MSWTTTLPDDPKRQITVPVLVTSVKATVANTATLANVIQDLDISSDFASGAAVDAGDIEPIPGFRTLAFKGTDAASTTLVIKVTISGTSLFGRKVKESFTLNTGNSWFKETAYAYTGTPTITLTTTNAAASDLLDVAMAAFGVEVWSTTLQSVILAGFEDGYANATTNLTVGTDVLWDSQYSTLDPDDEVIAVGNVFWVHAYQNKQSDPAWGTLTA